MQTANRGVSKSLIKGDQKLFKKKYIVCQDLTDQTRQMTQHTFIYTLYGNFFRIQIFHVTVPLNKSVAGRNHFNITWWTTRKKPLTLCCSPRCGVSFFWQGERPSSHNASEWHNVDKVRAPFSLPDSVKAVVISVYLSVCLAQRA